MKTSELPQLKSELKSDFLWGFSKHKWAVMLIFPTNYIYELHDMQNNIRLTLYKSNASA